MSAAPIPQMALVRPRRCADWQFHRPMLLWTASYLAKHERLGCDSFPHMSLQWAVPSTSIRVPGIQFCDMRCSCSSTAGTAGKASPTRRVACSVLSQTDVISAKTATAHSNHRLSIDSNKKFAFLACRGAPLASTSTSRMSQQPTTIWWAIANLVLSATRVVIAYLFSPVATHTVDRKLA